MNARAIVVVAFLSSGCNALSGINGYGVGELEDGDAGDAPLELGAETGSDAAIESSVDTTPEATPLETDVLNDALEAGADAADGAPDTCVHSNGLGQTYMLCTPLGVPGDASTYSVEMARAARDAWPFAGTDGDGTCSTPGFPSYAWRKTATSCAGWSFTNGSTGAAGHVYLGSTACSCPDSSTPTWD